MGIHIGRSPYFRTYMSRRFIFMVTVPKKKEFLTTFLSLTLVNVVQISSLSLLFDKILSLLIINKLKQTFFRQYYTQVYFVIVSLENILF